MRSPGDRGPRPRRLAAAALVVAGVTACAGAAPRYDEACGVLEQPVALPAPIASVVPWAVGARPDVLDVVVLPWAHDARVFLRRDRSAELDDVAAELREAGLTVRATLRQDDALREFAVMFEARPDLVQSVSAADLLSSVVLAATRPGDAARITALMRDDPRVANVATGENGPVGARLAPALYRVVKAELDRLEQLLPPDRQADLRELRSLAAAVNRAPDEPAVPLPEPDPPVGRLQSFSAAECD